MTGLIQKFHFVEGDVEERDGFIIETVQDIDPILEANKRKYNDASSTHKSDVFNHVASIPLVIIEQYKNEKGIDLLKDRDAMRKFLNDPDNRLFRTKPGTV